MTYHIMVSEVCDPVQTSYHGVRKCLTNPPTTNIALWNFISKGTDTGISTRISLCHSGFKGPAVSSVLKNSDFQ